MKTGDVIEMLIKFVSFVTAFLLLACTITAISAAMYEEPEHVSEEPVRATDAPTESATQSPATEKQLPEVLEHPQTQEAYTPRLTSPDVDNTRYYSSENPFYAAGYGMPNCTCYAWGRAYEISGERPELSPYDACTWYDYNAENQIYDYGDQPEQGAIACWAYADGGPGHVAVVEQVDDDTVLLSNSAYSGAEFYMDTVPVDDPSAGRENWIFQGYIYPDGKAERR